MKLINLKIILFLYILLFSFINCWFWSSDDDGEVAAEEKLVTEDEGSEKDKDTEVKAGPSITKDEGQTEKLTQQEIHKINREEFDRRLAETIKAHEIHHLSPDSHLDSAGDHNLEFDHEAFMGDEAEEFNNLTPEESKLKLSKIVKKIDVDNDTLIDPEELTIWIKETQKRSVLR